MDATSAITMDNRPAWGRGTAPAAHPPLAGDRDADVCVVGLGGTGLAAIGALRARDERLQIAAIDAGTVGGGAAGRNGGFLLAGIARFYHDAVGALGRERARALYARTREEIVRIARETPDVVRLTGSLRIAASAEERADIAAHVAALTADGFAAEPYRGPEGEGMLIPGDGVFEPLERCRLLAARTHAAGVALHEHTPAITVSPGIVRTPRGVIRADRVIVAVDGGLERVLPALAPRVRTARLQMLATAPAPEVCIPRPVYRRWGLDYWQQLADGRLVLGGFRDRGGDAEWTTEAEPTRAVQDALDRLLRETLGVRAAVTHRWASSVAFTRDGLPVIEEVDRGVFAVGAYSGTGNVVGAIAGRAAADLALGIPAADATLLASGALFHECSTPGAR